MKRAVLGKVAKESYQDFMSAIVKATHEIEQFGTQELESLKPSEPRWEAYKVLNILGYYYAGGLIRAALADLDPREENFPSQIPEAIQMLDTLYNEAESKLELRDEGVIRQAAQEMPGLLPPWVDLDRVLADGQASYEGKGVYIRDFYHNIQLGIGQVWRALRRFLVEDKRPELMAFRQEGAGGEYIPAAILSLDENEERTLLKTVIQEANRKIARLRSYGLYSEPIPAKDFTIIRWLNGPSIWQVDNVTDAAVLARSRGVQSLSLDANMALIPFHPVLVEKVVETFDDLPLYSYSVEAKERGEYPEATDRNVVAALRGLLEQGNPGLDREEISLKTAEEFGIMKAARDGDPVAREHVVKLLTGVPIALPYMRLFKRWLRIP